jgi:hypothetical protein
VLVPSLQSSSLLFKSIQSEDFFISFLDFIIEQVIHDALHFWIVIVFDKFVLALLIEIAHLRGPLVSGVFTGFLWDTANLIFVVNTGAATRKGLVLITKILVVPSKEPGERTTRSSGEQHINIRLA